jgi:general secretion pathway protein I
MPGIDQHTSPVAGFTLIEVVVALAIAGLGLGLLVAATGSGLESSTAAARATTAASHAQSRLAQVGLTLPLKRGDYSGDEGDGFRWRVHIADPSGQGQVGSTAVALYPVTVTESWRSGVQQKTFSLYSERTGPP